jgi:hypothetical protein
MLDGLILDQIRVLMAVAEAGKLFGGSTPTSGACNLPWPVSASAYLIASGRWPS